MLDKYNYLMDNIVTIDEIELYIDEINERIKILKCKNMSADNLQKVVEFAQDNKIGKIISNCLTEDWEHYIESGFELEGFIEGYFKGKVALCMSYFSDENRKKIIDYNEKELIVKDCLKKSEPFSFVKNKHNYTIRDANENDVKDMVSLFSEVFSSYPSPVYDEEYIKKTMRNKILYKVAVFEDKVVGIVSADMDRENLNAEITDCVTSTEHRCKGITSNIIHNLEKDLKSMGFVTLYSLSRAINVGVNKVFSKHNYAYNGRLVNNCNICGSFEDMNIWVKTIKN